MTDLPKRTTPLHDDEFTIRQQAADWIVQLDETRDDTTRQALQAACKAWCEQDERHARIFRQIQQMWQASAQPVKPRPVKKVVAATLVTILALWFMLPVQSWLADVHMGPGEVRQITMADGTQLSLDSGTSVDIHINGEVREVHLHTGRVLAEVAKDPQGRAFQIVGRDGAARALGTRYVVDQQGSDTAVSVLESSVEISNRNHPQKSIVLGAGQTVRYTRDTIGEVAPLLSPTVSEAWAHGRLVFNEAPLAQVVEVLSRYRRGVLTLRQADALADLRFTGVLPANDSDAALRILTQSLPLVTGQVTPYVVWLEPLPVVVSAPTAK